MTHGMLPKMVMLLLFDSSLAKARKFCAFGKVFSKIFPKECFLYNLCVLNVARSQKRKKPLLCHIVSILIRKFDAQQTHLLESYYV